MLDELVVVRVLVVRALVVRALVVRVGCWGRDCTGMWVAPCMCRAGN